MIYLDYSATTPVKKEVLDSFNKVTTDLIGNPNSLHKLGVESKKIITASTEQIAKLLNIKPHEIIYTSGASESNNTAIKGVANKYKNRGNHIITTNLEHSSVYGPLGYLQKNGFKIDITKTNNGIVDLEYLENLMTEETILVTINSVNSETGLLQPIEQISKIINKYPKCLFHVDMTQSIGKININLDNIDLISFSAHKFYGIKGIGCLIKKENIEIEPLIHGGKSTTNYRSGTPCTGLIVSLSKALRLALEEINIEYIKTLEQQLIIGLKKLNISINHNENCIPYIVNISVPNIKPETMLHALEESDIYISTQSACSLNNSKSKAVYELTNSDELSNTSLRISLSNLTTKQEIEQFLNKLEECLNKLNIR